MTDEAFKSNGCKYRTFQKHYQILNKGTAHEDVIINPHSVAEYERAYNNWSYLKNFSSTSKIDRETTTAEVIQWRLCDYFHQLNIGRLASHTILNYSAFLSLMGAQFITEPRDCLVLDECHSLEQEIVKFKGISISKRRWKRYIPDFKLPSKYGYDDMEKWCEFVQELEEKMYAVTGQKSVLTDIKALRRINANLSNAAVKDEDDSNDDEHNDIQEQVEDNSDDDPYGLVSGYYKKKPQRQQQQHSSYRVTASSNSIRTAKELRKRIQQAQAFLSDDDTSTKLSKEVLVDAINDRDRLTRNIDSLLSDKNNWIVGSIRYGGDKEGSGNKNKNNANDEVTRVELKPLDVAPYCKDVFSLCSKTLMMSATILDHKAFCQNVGLDIDKVKFIAVDSDFPVVNRPISPLNVAWLNAKTIALEDTQRNIAKAIDKIMTMHKDDKGIIHTTSYSQLRFIQANLSEENKSRLIETDPEIQREDIIQEHFNSGKPTVLISPSLYLGLDLKDDLSRFQIITKVPYPDMNDRWISAKMKANEEWYRWQTALRLVQAYGRSIRSKDDWAKTYVLDSMFNTFVNKNRHMLPQWFLSAISHYCGNN
jgi:Rad3-related DNA helicase